MQIFHATGIHCDKKGTLHLTFDDVAAVRADTVFIDKKSNEISGLIDGLLVSLGVLPLSVQDSVKTKPYVRLSARHPQGHQLSLNAALQTV